MKILCICGKYFTPKTITQKCCDNDVCRDLWKKHYNKYYRKTSYLYSEETMKLISGCIVESTIEGRCDKYLSCKNNTQCLFQIPDHWQGFTCVGDPIGYKRKIICVKESIDVSIEECYGICSLNKFK